MFGELGSKLVFLKNISSHTHALFSSNSMLWGVSAQNCFDFSKFFFFLEFWSIEPIFQSIKIAIKNFDQPLFVSIDAQLILDQSKHFWSIEPNFRSIENRIESFLKTWLSRVQLTFQKNFKLSLSLSLSLSSIGQGFNPFFCHFPPILLQGFSPLRSVRLFYPSFCIDFQVSCIFLGKFWTCNFWGFWWFSLFLLKLINGFLF